LSYLFGHHLSSPLAQLTTNGSNFQGLWQFAVGVEENILEEDDIYSNDIYAILKTYGVEMARAAILREMGGVFGAYNIQVDRRHLELIADYMVRHMFVFIHAWVDFA
jgi:DNA-directed RNA polymerase I subunit RPA1